MGLLTNIIYNRDGMCHTIVNITGSGLPYDLQKSIIEEIFGAGALDKPKAYTPMNESKAKFAKFGVIRQVIHDSMTLCNWVWPMTFSPRKDRGYKGDLSVEAQYMAAITGQAWAAHSLPWWRLPPRGPHRVRAELWRNSSPRRFLNRLRGTFPSSATAARRLSLTGANWPRSTPSR